MINCFFKSLYEAENYFPHTHTFPFRCDFDCIQQDFEELQTASNDEEANKTACSVPAWIIKSLQGGELPLSHIGLASSDFIHMHRWQELQLISLLEDIQGYKANIILRLIISSANANPSRAHNNSMHCKWFSQGRAVWNNLPRAEGVILSGSRQGG